MQTRDLFAVANLLVAVVLVYRLSNTYIATRRSLKVVGQILDLDLTLWAHTLLTLLDG